MEKPLTSINQLLPKLALSNYHLDISHFCTDHQLNTGVKLVKRLVAYRIDNSFRYLTTLSLITPGATTAITVMKWLDIIRLVHEIGLRK